MDGTSRESCAAVLESRVLAYAFFSRAFAAPMDEGLLRDALSEQYGAIAAAFSPDWSENAWRAMAEALRRACAGEGPAALEGAFNRAFVGPLELAAPPWESAYVYGDRSLLRESTLAVRRCYAEAGFVFSGKGAEADDHLAVELEFMARLGEQGAKAWKEGDMARARGLLESSKRFLHDHVIGWTDRLACDLSKAEGVGPYAAVAAALCEFLGGDAAFLDEALALCGDC